MQRLGILATKNYQRGRFDDAEAISGQTLASSRLVGTTGCLSCPIRCARVVEHEGKRVKGPELETLVLLGSNLENASLDRIIEINVLLDELGMDTMSFGATVGFAMELAERGLADLGVRFGDVEGLAQVAEDVAYRRGAGDELAEGSRIGSRALRCRGVRAAGQGPRTRGVRAARRVGSRARLRDLEPRRVPPQRRLRCRARGSRPGHEGALDGVEAGAHGDVPGPDGGRLGGGVLPVHDLRRAAGAARAGSSRFARQGCERGAVGVERCAPSCLRALPAGMLAIPMPLVPHLRAVELATGMRLGFGPFWAIGIRGFTLKRELNRRFGLTARRRHAARPLHRRADRRGRRRQRRAARPAQARVLQPPRMGLGRRTEGGAAAPAQAVARLGGRAPQNRAGRVPGAIRRTRLRLRVRPERPAVAAAAPQHVGRRHRRLPRPQRTSRRDRAASSGFRSRVRSRR